MDVNHNKPLRLIKDYIYIMIGAAITGVVFNVFLLPNRIAAGSKRDQHHFRNVWF